MNQDLISYYKDRAAEYDQVYSNPPEQEDLLRASHLFQSLFSGKRVLEIACGTGYWTEQMAKTARSVFATDINERMLDLARARPTGAQVTFALADMYSLAPEQRFDAVFGGFIWSHIVLQDLDGMIDRLAGMLEPGGLLVFIDSNPVENTHHDRRKIAKTDEYGNCYQSRKLENGATYLVLKNFPSDDFLHQKLSRVALDISVVRLKYYWIVKAEIVKKGK